MSDEVIWLRPEQPARGPKPTRSRREIARAAVRLADVEDIEAVSMRKLASDIGLGTMSLYRYVQAKDDLLDLMVDETAAEFEIPAMPSEDWRADLTALAWQQRGIVHRHPWLPELTLARFHHGPNTLRYLEFCLHSLHEGGVDGAAAFEVTALINNAVAAYARTEVVEPTVAEQRAARFERHLRAVVADGKHPHLARALADSGPADAPDERFARMLRRLIEGLTTMGR